MVSNLDFQNMHCSRGYFEVSFVTMQWCQIWNFKICTVVDYILRSVLSPVVSNLDFQNMHSSRGYMRSVFSPVESNLDFQIKKGAWHHQKPLGRPASPKTYCLYWDENLIHTFWAWLLSSVVSLAGREASDGVRPLSW